MPIKLDQPKSIVSQSGTANASATRLAEVNNSVGRLKAILDKRPLYLAIETTNICNAACVFCAYPKMQRHKSVMDPALFTKIITDYVDMGGGAVGLTPIVGDVLADPNLMDRLALLRETKEITHVSFTTNAIAWHRFSERDRKAMLASIDSISISLGGVDAKSYKTMFAVDRFDAVGRAIDDMCEIKRRDHSRCEIHLYFRVNRPVDELMADAGMNVFRRPEIDSIASINNFGNWGGLVGREDMPDGAHLVQVEQTPSGVRQSKRNPCFVHFVNPEITCEGLVSACGCMNAEADALILGDVRDDHLRDIWQGAERTRLMSLFGTDDLPDICNRCSYYDDGERFLASPPLARFKVGDNPWEVLRKNAATTPAEQLGETIRGLWKKNLKRIALYGAGSFTRVALSSPQAREFRTSIVAIVDDNPDLRGTRLLDWKITSKEQVVSLDIDAVVLSTDYHGQTLWRASRKLRDRGIPVVALTGSI